jgi:carbon storage regulator
MLVLSRKKNESIIIDSSIVITIVEIRGDKVRLGIEAPREVPIHRSEVQLQLTPNGVPPVSVAPIPPAESASQTSSDGASCS